MPSEPRARRPLSRRSLAAASVLAFVALAGCVDGQARPTGPTYSGIMRPDPTRPPRPGEPAPSTPVSDRYAESRNAYMPRHIPRNEQGNIQRIAVLLPFSSPDPTVQKLTRGLYNGIQMALFEMGVRDVVLMPRDASSPDAGQTSRVAEQAIKDGAVAVIGPLFAQQVAPVAGRAAEVHAPVLAFSTDISAIGQGAYLVSLTPQGEVKRIVDWASQQGVTHFAMFGPDTSTGHAVEQALREEAGSRGANVISVEYYSPNDDRPQATATRLGRAVKASNDAEPNKTAVLIPDSGVQLRSIASFLPYVGDLNLRQVKFIGTGLWNDPGVWRESALRGGAFPAPDPAAQADFTKRYQAIFGEAPTSLASYGYDAGAIAATLAKFQRFDAAMVQTRDGWGGVNGLFRFQPDGSTERALAVLQIQDGATKVVSPPLKAFAPGS